MSKHAQGTDRDRAVGTNPEHTPDSDPEHTPDSGSEHAPGTNPATPPGTGPEPAEATHHAPDTGQARADAHAQVDEHRTWTGFGSRAAEAVVSPIPLDGNVAAGVLADIFAMDATVARARCDSCGAVAHVAEAVVFLDAPGLVVRCRSCESVLMRVVESENNLWLDVRGLSYLEFDRQS